MSYKDLTGTSPYYDDFNPELNFLRILFVPGRPLQVRELTQAQTILQNQIAQVSNHLFRNGTPVLGAKINLTLEKPGARFFNKQMADRSTGQLTSIPLVGSAPGAIYSLSDFVGRTFNNVDPLAPENGGVATKTFTVTHALLSDDETEIILYFSFGGSPVEQDNLYFDAVGSGGTALRAVDDMFFGLAASCEPGVIYRDGQFVSTLSQEIIVGKGVATTDGSYAIGFRFDERIITEADTYYGAGLYDNSQGFYNQSAPGAHRYQVTPVLDFYDKTYQPTVPSTENDAFNQFLAKFSTLVELEDGKVTLDQRDTQYAKLLDLLARRTYDESGNYTVRDFSLTVKEDPNDSGNLIYELGPGKAYVLGYEIEKPTSSQLIVPKSRDYLTKNNTYALSADHSYFVIDNAANAAAGVPVGSPMIFRNLNLAPGTQLSAYDQGVDRANGNSVPRASSTLIGTCRVHSLVKYGSSWRLYVIDASGSLVNNAQSVKSLRLSSETSGTTEAVVVVRTYEDTANNIGGTAVSGGSFRDPLIYEVDSATILKSLVPSETSYIHVVKKEGVFNGSGVLTFTADNNSQEFFTTAEDGVPLALVNVSGTWTHIPTPSLTINNNSNPATISITDIAHAGRSAVVYLKVLETEGLVRTKTLAVFTETKTVTLPTSATEITNLAKEDIFRIVSITQTSNVRSDYPTPYNLSADDIAKLRVNNGQKDFYYDVGNISGWNRLNTYANSSNPTTFQIVYEYFNHSAGEHGYFCVNSYPFSEEDYVKIPNFKAANGKTYKLINSVDFRPKLSEINGRTYQSPVSRLRTDAECYTARNDRVVLTSTGEFTAIQGINSFTPDFPNEPANAMSLYTVALNPFTFSNKDLRVKKVENRRYTMRDIGALDRRLSNLEEYTALSLLELRANDLEIIDASTGFNKFKNGIFSDPFKGHQFGDTDDLSYRCAAEVYFGGGISCPAASTALELNIESAPTNWKNTITLAPTGTEVFIKNEFASGSINLNPYLFFTWNGTVELDPAVDTWFDVQQAPDIVNTEIGPTIIQNVNAVNDPMPTLSLPSMAFTLCGLTPEDEAAIIAQYSSSAEAAREQYERDLAAWEQRQRDRQNSTTGGGSGTTTTTVINDRIVATNIAPFMRTIPVEVHSQGMRQGAPLRAYLDNSEVTLVPLDSNYVTPLGDPAGAGRPRVSSTGEFRGTFLVPNGIPTGTKQFVIIDDEDTSSATTNFTSQGTIQIRQRTVTSVRQTITRIVNPIIPSRPPGRIRPEPPRITGTGQQVWADPIAQSFLIEEPNGCFISSIDVFFKTKPSSGGIDDQPVSIYIVEMENGTPTNRIVPFSMTTIPSSAVNANAEVPALGATTFTFTDPIFLEGLTEYAFILFSNSRKYEAWISTLGEQDIFNYNALVGGSTTPIAPDTRRTIGVQEGATQEAFLSDRFISTGGVDVPSLSGAASEQRTVPGQLTNGSFLPRVDPTIAFRGTNSGGRGIAEQPYLGSLFKSQNSTTWTADQLSDLTFRMRRYKFSLAPSTIVLRDRKTDVFGASLYPFADQVYGDSDSGNNPGKLKIATTLLNVGEMVLPNTSTSYRQAFHSGSSGTGYSAIVNKRLNFLTAEKYLDNATNPANRLNYSAEISLATTNALVSPIIDKQQLRLIASRNLASPYDLSEPSRPAIVSPAYDFGPAFDCGTYISKTVNLLNASDDLTVIVDAKLPNESLIKVSYRTSVVTPSYFTAAPSTIAGTELIGKVCRLIYRKSSDLSVGNPHGTDPTQNPSFVNSANPRVRCLVTDVADSTVSVKSVNDISKFKIGSSITNMDKVVIVDESTATDIEAQSISKIVDWSNSTNYAATTTPGIFDNAQYVFHIGRLWKRNSTFTQYATGMEPAVGGSAWIDIPYAEVGSLITAATPIEWREMVLDEEINPLLSVGTRFVEYKYRPVDIPEDFTSFSIKIEMYSKNPIDVPIVKNLRAIATI